jgi:hypothetical protein
MLGHQPSLQDQRSFPPSGRLCLKNHFLAFSLHTTNVENPDCFEILTAVPYAGQSAVFFMNEASAWKPQLLPISLVKLLSPAHGAASVAYTVSGLF